MSDNAAWPIDHRTRGSPLPEAKVAHAREAVDAAKGEPLDGHAVLRAGLRDVPFPLRQRLHTPTRPPTLKYFRILPLLPLLKNKL